MEMTLVKSTLAEDQGEFSAHNHLYFQFQGNWYPLLAFMAIYMHKVYK